MTRIIGGLAGSLKLVSPAKVTRPTSDRVRESIFNRLAARDLIDGSAILDLYAGTGALGLEAISRGAAKLVMVEKDSKAAGVCSANAKLLAKLDLGSTAVVNQPVSAFLQNPSIGEFDLVFVDPPYELSNSDLYKNLVDLLGVVSADAVIIVERSSRDSLVEIPKGLRLDDEKNYGDTTVYWLSKTD